MTIVSKYNSKKHLYLLSYLSFEMIHVSLFSRSYFLHPRAN